MNAPVVMFVYNRIDHTRETIESLKNNYLIKETDVYIFADGYRNEVDKADVIAVRECATRCNIKSITWL